MVKQASGNVSLGLNGAQDITKTHNLKRMSILWGEWKGPFDGLLADLVGNITFKPGVYVYINLAIISSVEC